MGCIFAEIIFGEPLFPGNTDLDQLDHILMVMGTPTKETWPKFFLNEEMIEEKTYTDAEFQQKLDQSDL